MPLTDGTPLSARWTVPPSPPAVFALIAAALAAGISTLLAYNVPPSSTLLNQALALVGWGGFVAVLGGLGLFTRWGADRGFFSMMAALAIAMVASAAAPLWTGQPASLAGSSFGTVLAAAVLVAAGAAASASGRLESVFGALAGAWLVAAFAGLAIGVVQVFAPDLCDGDILARTAFPGRAVGNLRQPNHLSSVLLWAAAGLVWLAHDDSRGRRWPTALFAGLYAALMAGVVMTASRTGMVGVGLLAVWGLIDRRLPRRARLLLIIGPLIYAASWLALDAWASATHHVFGAEERLATQTDISSSRFKIWHDTLELIAMHPWAGVGFGNFNFAWTLTPFPHRPVAFFDHTHNIELQFLVELGIPLGLLMTALLAHATWRSFVAARRAEGSEGTALGAAFVMLLVMVLHSQLEYPLWYAYFLMPTALLVGLCLGRAPREPARTRPRPRPRSVSAWGAMAGAAVALGGGFLLFDYMRVVQIFAPAENAISLEQRIAWGERSWFFSHHAEYAAVTTAERPSQAMDAFRGATHYLLDTRLMLAWAKAYAERGDLDRARYLADRLREFHNEKSDDFFAECDDADDPRPFQCDPPSRTLRYEDFE